MSANSDVGHPDNFPPHPQTAKCKTCRFWLDTDSIDAFDHVVVWGYCRQSPPRPWIVGDPTDDYDLPAGDWPVTLDFDWCGEWKKTETT